MKQLIELRHNPLFIPVPGGDGTTSKPFHELIFIAGRKGYELDLQQQPRQTQQTHVFRCMADAGTIAVTAHSLLSLLSADMKAAVLKALNDAANNPS